MASSTIKFHKVNLQSSHIAIIPARGGSKRIPNKNIRPFHGKPIIAYSIETALKSGLFSRVIVSTDDKNIAEISKNYGAEVPFLRSPESSSDTATTYDALKEVLTRLKDDGQNPPEIACCIYPTAPFVTTEILAKLVTCLASNSDATSVLPVVPFSFPIQRAFELTNGKLRYINPSASLTRSQDLETTYHDAGQYYCFRVKNIIKYGRLIDESSMGIIISHLTCQDIDNEDDWTLAELKWQRIQSLVLKEEY